MTLIDDFSRVTLILSDVDGVMTDGGLVFDNHGHEAKQFFIRDGLGIRLWQRAGMRFGMVTGRESEIVKQRAEELNIHILRQGSDDKLGQIRNIATDLKLPLSSICYLGDDLPDLPAIRAVGLGVAVADASDEVRAVADYVTNAAGGRGAVREVVELIMRQTGRWDEAISPYERADQQTEIKPECG